MEGMTLKVKPIVTVALVACVATVCSVRGEENPGQHGGIGTMKLSKPGSPGRTSVEEAIRERRSTRAYSRQPLSFDELSQILWAAQGVTGADEGLRTAPSAGALYPLEIYVAVGSVEGLPKGVYRYQPRAHELVKVGARDVRAELVAAAMGQEWLQDAPVALIFSAFYDRTFGKYGERGKRYVHMEVGHAAQNVFLQAVALKLGAAVVGAFHDDKVKKIVGMGAKETPLYIMPVGRK
jgi:SagB-type dehydrogenase family enzyme